MEEIAETANEKVKTFGNEEQRDNTEEEIMEENYTTTKRKNYAKAVDQGYKERRF